MVVVVADGIVQLVNVHGGCAAGGGGNDEGGRSCPTHNAVAKKHQRLR